MSRNYLEAFAILIIAFALGFFLLLPKTQELRDLQTRVQGKIAELKERGEYYAGLRVMVDDLNYHREGLEKIGTALPEGADAAAVMGFAQTAAMQSGLAVKGADYSYSAPEVPVDMSADMPVDVSVDANAGLPPAEVFSKKYVISMELTGNYGSLKNFLSIIERSSRLIAVESLDIGSKSEIGGERQSPETPSLPAAADGETEEKVLDYSIKLSANYY